MMAREKSKRDAAGGWSEWLSCGREIVGGMIVKVIPCFAEHVFPIWE